MKKESNKMSKKIERLSKEIRLKSRIIGQEQPVLEFFYEYPNSKHSIREIAQKLGFTRSTTHNYLKLLKEKGIISSDNKWVDNWQNRLIKTNYYLEKLAKSGLIDYLEKELAASAIVLFGSFRKGESEISSDIDIFVECAREKDLDFKKYEKYLGHKIQLFTKSKITLLPDRLFNNVINGIKIKGYFTIK